MSATRTATRTVTIELPDTLVSALDTLDGIEDRAWKALVLDLLRDAQISQGKAARLLNVTRYDIIDMMARYRIPSGPQTAEEAERDVEAARLGSRPAKRDAGSQ